MRSKPVNRLGGARRRRAGAGVRSQPNPGAVPIIRRFLIPISIVIIAVAAGWALLPDGSSTPGANAGDPALVSRGAEVYDANCAVCHGVNLEGQAG
ncbi:MAG: c-type cytochrome [Rhodospirillales bacterium]|jgi:hypothetical protein|nr:c-type cytochrome [Rhodospirillales bacterium]